MTPFSYEARTRVVCGAGAIDRLGELAGEFGARRVLIVSEQGIIDAGHAGRAIAALQKSGISAETYSGFAANPDSRMAADGCRFAQTVAPDLIVGLGGGSSMDLAKAMNFLLTNGGHMRDYWGYGKNAHPLIPMIGVPTTTGTGSEAQSYALISDEVSHRKMACGTPSAAFRIAILDPTFCESQPFDVLVTSGFDAISHAVETWVTKKRTALSAMLTVEAWRLLNLHFERVLQNPKDEPAMAAMQWGAYLAGWAIEQSMLGVAHACANPLTQKYGTVHGRALAILLPHAVEWNADERYAALDPNLAARLREIARAARLPATLRDAGVPESDLPELAERAAEQWTGQFNPRPVNAAAALELYRCAY